MISFKKRKAFPIYPLSIPELDVGYVGHQKVTVAPSTLMTSTPWSPVSQFMCLNQIPAVCHPGCALTVWTR